MESGTKHPVVIWASLETLEGKVRNESVSGESQMLINDEMG